MKNKNTNRSAETKQPTRQTVWVCLKCKHIGCNSCGFGSYTSAAAAARYIRFIKGVRLRAHLHGNPTNVPA